MNFLAPGWIGLALLASVGVVAIHLISWRLPRTVALPTARFVPDEPARRAARTIRPADLTLLALRIAILLAGGLALARPVFERTPDGTATVIAVEQSGPSADTAAVRRIERTGNTTYVVFDTVARVVGDEASALAALMEPSAAPSLSVGLVASIREARRLQSEYDTVRIVVASALRRDAFDNATLEVRALWPDSIRVIELPSADKPVAPVRVTVDADIADPIVAGIRLAESNGLLRGESRVIRKPAAGEVARAGEALVYWPVAPNARERVAGIHAAGVTAIGHLIPIPLVDSGRVIARWTDGKPAAVERARDGGCVRSIGFDVPDLGDFTLTPSFQRLAAVLLAPCGGLQRTEPAPDSLIRALAAPTQGTVTASGIPDQGNRMAALLMILAVLLGGLEWWVRQRSVPRLEERVA